MHENTDSDIFLINQKVWKTFLKQPLVQLPVHGFEITMNNTMIPFVIRFNTTCIGYLVSI